MNIQTLKEKLKNIDRPYGVEIGVFLGSDSRKILHNIRNSRIAIIDLFKEYAENESREVSEAFSRLYDNKIKLNYAVIRKEIEEFNTRGMIIQLDSKTACDKYKNGTFDFAYFNTNGYYNNIRKDISNWYLRVKKNGYLCGNGYTQYTPVKAAVDGHFKDEVEIYDDFWIVKI